MNSFFSKIKKIFLILTLFVMITTSGFCSDYLSDSNKNYGVSADNMFLTSLSVLNKLRYDVIEIQSTSGYILFSANSKDYILTVTSLTPVTSNIKILPANSVFSTGTIVQDIVFQALDIDKLNIMKKVP